jgi:hypothetical protein
LRRALRLIHSLPIFSFFLSTTGKISQFTPFRSVDPSARLSDGELYLIPPYTAVGFDQVMKGHEVQDTSHTIQDVTDLGFMARLGRPLYVIFWVISIYFFTIL